MGETKLAGVNSLKEGSYIIMGDAACIIKSMQTSKTGKHGHAKCRIEAVGILDGKKRIEVFTSHDNVKVPIIEKKNAQVLSIKGDIANIMNMETYETFDLKIPEELKEQAKEGSIIIYWEILNDKVMKQIK